MDSSSLLITWQRAFAISNSSKDLLSFRVKSNPKNPKLCPLIHLQAYIDRTKDLRTTRFLFTSAIPPYGCLGRERLGKWVKILIVESGANTSERIQSIRSVVASALLAKGVHVNEIMKQCNWATAHAFYKHYHLPAPGMSAQQFINDHEKIHAARTAKVKPAVNCPTFQLLDRLPHVSTVSMLHQPDTVTLATSRFTEHFATRPPCSETRRRYLLGLLRFRKKWVSDQPDLIAKTASELAHGFIHSQTAMKAPVQSKKASVSTTTSLVVTSSPVAVLPADLPSTSGNDDISPPPIPEVELVCTPSPLPPSPPTPPRISDFPSSQCPTPKLILSERDIVPITFSFRTLGAEVEISQQDDVSSSLLTELTPFTSDIDHFHAEAVDLVAKSVVNNIVDLTDHRYSIILNNLHIGFLPSNGFLPNPFRILLHRRN